MSVLKGYSTRSTPQTEKADARQVENSAGGYTFEITPLQRLARFLTLGVDGGTYYSSAHALTIQNASVVLDMLRTDHAEVVDAIVDVSTRGAAPRQSPGLFALALAASHGSDEERRYALSRLPEVARTGSTLFEFLAYVGQHRGKGPGLRRAVAAWYEGKTPEQVAYQAAKYKSRHGWSHRDVLRVARPSTSDPALNQVFGWITSGVAGDLVPEVVSAVARAHEPGADVAEVVRGAGRVVSWEMLPTESLGDADVWRALLDVGAVPIGALVRQLPRLTRLGVLTGEQREDVARRLTDQRELERGRIHPMNLLVDQRTYASGRGKGSSWTPVRQITDALDAAFYAAFGAVQVSGKRTMIGLDVSGSMGFNRIAGLPLTPREASAALCLVTVATEPDTSVFGFTAGRNGFGMRDSVLRELDISPRRRLDDVTRYVSGIPFGGTDCALPMLYAAKHGLEVDTFVIYTDNETWAGHTHPHQALRAYREKSGIPARLVVVGMTATGFSIADPKDVGMLDVAGFDTAVPNLIARFSAGEA